jgi:hypothetical protein
MNIENKFECNCPICLDDIIGLTNKTTTECGHHFHTKCLMQNITHNGFSCPYCRNILADCPNNNNENDSEYEEDSFIDEEEENENYKLRGLRWFNQRINNEELDQEEDEIEDRDESDDEEPMASLEETIQEFKKANITNNDLIEYILNDYLNEHSDNLTNNIKYKKVYTLLRKIDANYKNKLRELTLSDRVNNNETVTIITYDFQIPNNN